MSGAAEDQQRAVIPPTVTPSCNGSELFRITAITFLDEDPEAKVRSVPKVSRVPGVVLLGEVTTESICHQLQPLTAAKKIAPQVNFSQSFNAAESVLEFEAKLFNSLALGILA